MTERKDEPLDGSTIDVGPVTVGTKEPLELVAEMRDQMGWLRADPVRQIEADSADLLEAAASLLEQQAQTIERLRAENERLAKIEATVERVGCETCWQFHHPTNKHQEGD